MESYIAQSLVNIDPDKLFVFKMMKFPYYYYFKPKRILDIIKIVYHYFQIWKLNSIFKLVVIFSFMQLISIYIKEK